MRRASSLTVDLALMNREREEAGPAPASLVATPPVAEIDVLSRPVMNPR